MAPVLSTPFLLSILLAGTSTEAFAIVRPRKAANEIPPPEDYTVHNGVHYTGAHGPYGTGAPVPTTTTQAAGGWHYGPVGSSRLGTSCTPSTQTVTLSSSSATPAVITDVFPTNVGYAPAPSSSSSAWVGYGSPPIVETSGYGAPAVTPVTPVVSLGYKQPEEYLPTNTPIVPGQYTASSAWSSFNSSAVYMPTGTGRLPTGYLPEVTGTSMTSDSLIPYVTTSTSLLVNPQYPEPSSSPSSSAAEGYMTVQTSTAVESVISSGVVPGYGAPTSSPPPGYSSSAPPAYAASSATPPAYAAPSVTPPAYAASSVTPPAYAASSVTPPAYAASSVTPPVYAASSVVPPAASSSSIPPAYAAAPSSASPPAYSAALPSSVASVIGQVSSIAVPSPVYTPQGNQIYGSEASSTPTPTSTPPAGYQAVASTATPPAYAAPTTLATSVAPVAPSSSAAGYGYVAPNGASSMVYAA